MKLNFFLLFVISSFFLVGVQAQAPFDRGFRTSDNSLVARDFCVSGDGFAVLSFIVDGKDKNIEYADSISISKFNNKGTELWSKSFTVVDTFGYESKKLTGEGSISVNASKDGLTIRFSCVTADSTGQTAQSESFLELDNTGNIRNLQSRMYPFEDASGINNYSTATILDTVPYFANNSKRDATGNGFEVYSKNSIGDFWLHKNYQIHDSLLNFEEHLADLSPVNDSTLAFIGQMNEGNSAGSTFIGGLDPLGDLMWSTSLTSRNFIPTSIAAMNDSVFAFCGYTSDNNRKPVVALFERGIGVMWANEINIDSDTTFAGFDGLIVSDGSIIATGISKNKDGSENSILLGFNMSGEMMWARTFEARPISINDFNVIIETESTGAFLSNWAEKIGDDSTLIFPRIVQFDAMGSSSCEDTLDITSMNDIIFDMDTLIWDVKNMSDQAINWKLREKKKSPYSIPVLSLDRMDFCPNLPFEFTLHAETQGATSYAWKEKKEDGKTISRGSADSLVISNFNEYTVIVKMEEEFCYTLCDTTMMTKLDTPMVVITPDFTRFCSSTERPVTLAANVGKGSPPYSYSWSTGETTESIDLNYDEDQTYSVTVVDGCGLEAINSISGGPPRPDIIIGKSCLQAGECIGLRLVLTGVVNFENVTWSTGETGTGSIEIFETGTYSITGIDDCLYPLEKVIIISAEDLRRCFDVAVGTSCVAGKARAMIAKPTRDDLTDLTWSDGSTDTIMVISNAGTFTLNARDKCGNVIPEINFEVENSQLDACEQPSCVEFPDLFLVNGKDVNNKTFRGFKKGLCPIANYNIQIYNRWNEKVFEGNNVEGGWDGNYKESPAPAGGYFYIADYEEGGEPCVQSGTFTLLR